MPPCMREHELCVHVRISWLTVDNPEAFQGLDGGQNKGSPGIWEDGPPASAVVQDTMEGRCAGACHWCGMWDVAVGTWARE